MLKKIKINNLSLRKKKILFKCTHSGTKELDILLDPVNMTKPTD